MTILHIRVFTPQDVCNLSLRVSEIYCKAQKVRKILCVCSRWRRENSEPEPLYAAGWGNKICIELYFESGTVRATCDASRLLSRVFFASEVKKKKRKEGAPWSQDGVNVSQSFHPSTWSASSCKMAEILHWKKCTAWDSLCSRQETQDCFSWNVVSLALWVSQLSLNPVFFLSLLHLQDCSRCATWGGGEESRKKRDA